MCRNSANLVSMIKSARFGDVGMVLMKALVLSSARREDAMGDEIMRQRRGIKMSVDM